MPRYFFHLEDSQSFPDEHGTEIPDYAMARVEAARVVGQLLRDSPGKFVDHLAWRVVVTDDPQDILFVLAREVHALARATKTLNALGAIRSPGVRRSRSLTQVSLRYLR